MRNIKPISVFIILVIFSRSLFSQDLRTLETRVADLLAQMPSNYIEYTDILMNEIISLGDAGLKQICDQVVPVGSGDDVKPRFAIESLSRYLSQFGKESQRHLWEKLCISYASGQKDYSVMDFFMKQLQQVGGEASVNAMKGHLADQDMCSPALGVISAVGGPLAEKVLSDALKDKSLACAASVMNTLAEMKSGLAINEYISWAQSENYNIRAAAYNAMAVSANPLAYAVLSKAAKEASYSWEHTGATASLLAFAEACGKSGDVKTLDRICKTVIKKCNNSSNIQYKTEALWIYVNYHGYKALSLLLDAMNDPDKTYRNAALRFTGVLEGSPVTREWMAFYPKSQPAARPEIVNMLGDRKDELAAPMISDLLRDPDPEVRKEAAAAIVKISRRGALDALKEYLISYTGAEDQEAAKSALMTILDDRRMPVMLEVLTSGPPKAVKTVIELLAWRRSSEYFPLIYSLTSSQEKVIRDAAFNALVDVAGPSDQDALLKLLEETNDAIRVSDVQAALVNAASHDGNAGNRSSRIIEFMEMSKYKEKYIPVLSGTGGKEALNIVLKEFENGGPDLRDICFKALTSWNDYTASSALFEICASGNKTFESRAFNDYIRIVRSAQVPDDQKLLLLRKIMPYALSSERRNQILNEIADIKTYKALFYTERFLNDPETSAAAARAIMNIALPSSDNSGDMYGTLITDILGRAIPLLKGPESEYDRELIRKYLDSMPEGEGFVPMFNGMDLAGWQGLVENPLARSGMTPAELVRKQEEANKIITENWSVKDGCIYFSGNGDNLCSVKKYADFELLVDWKITKNGDSGIYLRGSPQVQIWDTSRTDVGAQVGSGGLYNNQQHHDKPLVVADNPVGDWNSFRIIMIGEKVSVWLNGILVVDDVVMENYWDRSIPIFPKEAIELQAHGNKLAFRDIYVREINEKIYNLTPEEKSEGFESLFNGRNLDNWVGNKESYVVEDGMIVIKPDKGSGGNLYTQGKYSDFIFRFEFKLTPAANNGLGIRAPLTGDAAYVGMELQILDNTAPVYANLEPYQYHGSVYGVIPAKRGYLNPVGEWNYEEVYVNGTHIKITLNGTVIVDGDIAEPRDNGTMDHRDHPGLNNDTGHIGFLGHGSVVHFRNIRIKDLIKKYFQ